MKNPLTHLLMACGIIVLMCGCTADLPQVVERPPAPFTLDYLVGHWVSQTDSTAFHEQWEKKNEGFYSGTGFVMQSGDTTFIEQLTILEVNKKWLYSAKVAGQNSDAAIPFRVVEMDQSGVSFENLKHDFPQRISYLRINQNIMEATISGRNDNQVHEVVFPFNRVRPSAAK